MASADKLRRQLTKVILRIQERGDIGCFILLPVDNITKQVGFFQKAPAVVRHRFWNRLDQGFGIVSEEFREPRVPPENRARLIALIAAEQFIASIT